MESMSSTTRNCELNGGPDLSKVLHNEYFILRFGDSDTMLKSCEANLQEESITFTRVGSFIMIDRDNINVDAVADVLMIYGEWII